jgi:hypothetical protein
MTKSRSNRSLSCALLSAALAAIVLVGSAGLDGASANDIPDDDEAPDTKFFRNILMGLGLRRDGAGIDYRERSPLVVPPSRNLPLPENTATIEKNPAWPKDPDVKRAKEIKAERSKPRRDFDETTRPELPSQLNRAGAAAKPGQRPTGDSKDPTVPSTQAELQTKSIWNLDALWGRNKEEYGTFVREPARSSLTEPPPGYRTPSPAQPYGVGKEKYTPTAINPMDTPAMRGVDR